ncbi:RICIN domain-containing protein [Streptomyces sp. XH2]|uniref:RICIN domain-containing protein n=1 Tax=Streptomyces sp. XH2 TaxID=3412483 RepID=UPI003C7D9A9C
MAGGSNDDGASVVQLEVPVNQDPPTGMVWILKLDRTGYIAVNAGSNEYLDVADGSTERGANVIQRDGSLEDSQRWRFTPVK